MADPDLEPAFVALALAMPSENDIAREIGKDIDPNAIFQSRSWLRAALGSRLAPALRETYRRLDDGSPFAPDAASAGRRALKNACLDLLAATAAASAIALAARQYHQATNMTDRMAALTTLSLYPVPERQAALDDFYRRYSGNPLVIDKWFALQATIPRLTPSSPHRCFKRHGISRLPEIGADRGRQAAFVRGRRQNLEVRFCPTPRGCQRPHCCHSHRAHRQWCSVRRHATTPIGADRPLSAAQFDRICREHAVKHRLTKPTAAAGWSD